MLFESLEARRLMSVVAGDPASLVGIQATQSGSGTLTVKQTTLNESTGMTVIEGGTRNDFGGLIGAGNVAVFDANNNEVIFGGLSNKPISLQVGGSGGFVNFDGLTHVANANLGGGGGFDNFVDLIDEGAGGSVITCGGGTNFVAVPFSHHVKINDGGGTNNIVLNSDFFADTTISGSTVTQTDFNESVMLGNTSADLTTVQVGGGTNTIVDYAGNLNITAGGGFNTLYVQGASGTVTNPPKTFSTPWVDVIQQKGIDEVIGFTE